MGWMQKARKRCVDKVARGEKLISQSDFGYDAQFTTAPGTLGNIDFEYPFQALCPG